MATKFADRAFLSMNGAQFSDVQTARLRRNFNARPVKGMTTDGFNPGYVEGNTEYEIEFTLAVENDLGRPKLEDIDYATNDVQLTFVVGSDQYICKGLFPMEIADDAAGVGEEVKTTNRFGCRKVLDATGNSSLFNLVLSA